MIIGNFTPFHIGYHLICNLQSWSDLTQNWDRWSGYRCSIHVVELELFLIHITWLNHDKSLHVKHNYYRKIYFFYFSIMLRSIASLPLITHQGSIIIMFTEKQEMKLGFLPASENSIKWNNFWLVFCGTSKLI